MKVILSARIHSPSEGVDFGRSELPNPAVVPHRKRSNWSGFDWVHAWVLSNPAPQLTM
jgi:hypothetical protein